jgi:hypothetical protein
MAWELRVLWNIGRLFLYVGLGSFIGAVFEYRNWLRYASFMMRPLMKWARISEVSASAFLTAFVSHTAANSMLASARDDGEISRKEMLAGGVANAFPTKVSHFLRILFPLAGAIGWPGVAYFAIQVFTGFVRTVIVWMFIRSDKHLAPEAGGAARAGILVEEPLPWSETFAKSTRRTWRIIIRVFMISVPMYVIVAILSALGFFDAWKNAMPAAMSKILPPGMLTVVAARLGGVLSAAAAALELRDSNALSNIQILAAFLIGNMFTNPIRAARRNLPAALGIFPGKDGLIIVMFVQAFRFVAALLAVAVLLWFFA